MIETAFLPDLRDERSVLRVSTVVSLLLAVLGIVFGIFAGSYAILFDGLYSLIDVGVGLLSLVVASLITTDSLPGVRSTKLQERFSMGFWHLEPMVLGLNGMMLIGASVYALFGSVSALLRGGHDIAFGWAIVYAAITCAISGVISLIEIRSNRRLGSELVRIDIHGWIMSTAIAGALLFAFVFAFFLGGTRWNWIAPYVDPAILALVCLVIIPLPVPAVRQALSDILLITPVELKQQVDSVAQAFVAKHGLLSYRAYTARVGRSKDIEIYFIVPPHAPARTITEWDALRNEVADLIGGNDPHTWLTVVFTGDPEWAE